MTNTTPAEEVLKTDVLGRVKTPRARQEVNYQTFATWVQRRRRARGKYPLRAKPRPAPPVRVAEPLRLLEAVVEKASTAAVGEPLRVPLPGGGWMEVGDARQAVLAAELLRALASPAC